MAAEQFLLVLAGLILGAKVAGTISKHLGLPNVLGKILLGVVLGPSLLGLVTVDESLGQLSDIGVILLMFIAGLETDLLEMRRVGMASLLAALGGVIVPFVAGAWFGYLLGLGLIPSLFIGTILTATSVSITAQTLRDLGRLASREGTTILGAAIIDDVLGLMVLALVLALGQGSDPLPTLLKMLLFLVVAVMGGRLLIPPLIRLTSSLGSHDASLAITIALALLFAWASEAIGGLAAITGAYVIGVLVAHTSFRNHALNGISVLGFAFFVPLFFITIGLKAEFQGLWSDPLFSLLLLVIAVVTKGLGSSLGALAGGLTFQESLRVGAGMVPRGEVALVVAAVGLKAGIVDTQVYSLSVAIALLTTLLAPLMLKLLCLKETPVAEASPALPIAGALEVAPTALWED